VIEPGTPAPSASAARTAAFALRRRSIAALLATLVLAPLYLWTASAGLPFGIGEEHGEPYDLLGRALLHGQLHLEAAPRPELFELPDPYLPGRNARLRLHDASLYKGRYYLYFGVVPALVAFVPWRLLVGSDLPQPVAAAAFALGAFLFAALSLGRLVHDHLPVPRRRLFLALVVLGLANTTLFLLRSPHVYEVAICAGLFFVSAAVWLLLSAGRSPGTARLALAGLAMGLAVGCRPNLIVVAPLLPFLLRAAAPPAAARPGWLRVAAAIAGPFVVCLCLLGLYNHARFGSWTEFGTTYQLIGASRILRFDLRAVLPSLYYLFLAPPSVGLEFPFLVPFHEWSLPWPPFDGYFVDQHTTGALMHSPFLLILLAAPWILRRAPLQEKAVLVRRVVVLLAAGGLVPLATSFAFASVAMRFETDFLTFLMLPALFLWLALPACVPAVEGPRLRAVATLVFGWSALCAVLLSLTGASDDLRGRNPELYAKVERGAQPLQVVLGRLFDPEGRSQVRLRVAFPERLSAEREVFLSWGTVETHDLLWVSMPTPGVFTFTLDTAAARTSPGSASVAVPGVAFPAGEFHDLAIDLDRVRRRVRLVVDGQPPLDLAGRLVPLNVNRLWPGRGPRGHGAQALDGFGGVIIPEAMWLAGPPGLESLPPIARIPAIGSATRAEPAAAEKGQLRLVAGRPGADIFTGDGWRWIPCPSVDRLQLERPLRRDARGGAQPLVASGDASQADVLLVRYLPRERVRFELARWRGGDRVVAAGAAVEQGDRPAVVTLDRVAGEVRVRLGGREVLRTSDELLPLSGRRLYLDQMPPGLSLEP
jgi:hypothetical protein